METATYVKPERIWIKNHPQLNEKWVQRLIEKDTSILGLGELNLKGSEVRQVRAGRLDLLLQHPETLKRYEVEIQLGPSDESHIIRTIEYWDNERKLYPQYEHCAVIVAEDITSRFLNVISLFNGSIPLIAIQMQALRVGEHTTLVFTTILNELRRGLVGDDEDALLAPANRSYWEERASKKTVSLADQLLNLMTKIDPTLSLKYNKEYIGIRRGDASFNFISFVPKKNHIVLRLKLPRSNEFDEKIDSAGLVTLEYNSIYNYYQIRLTSEEVTQRLNALAELMELARKFRLDF